MDVHVDAISCSHCGHAVIHGDFPTPISPVPHLLNTIGLPPSGMERKAIQETISQSEAQMHMIQEEIVRAQEFLMSLARKRDALCQHIRTHTNLLSAMQRLPLEILSEIFLYHHNVAADNGKDIMEAAMIPGQVCHNWRSAALATPKLWSNIVLPITPYIPTTLVDLTSTFLNRSGDSPLSLQTIDAYMEDAEVDHLLHLIVEASCRWQHVDSDLKLFQCDLLYQIKDKIPLLESLTLSHYGVDEDSSGRNSIFMRAPRLRRVRMHLGMLPNKLDLPWNQLTRLELPKVHDVEFLAILADCSNLQEFTVVVNSRGDHLQPVFHDRLRSLAINILQGFTRPLDLLTLPTLSNLRYTDRYDHVAAHSLSQFITRSSCTLVQLDLSIGNRSTNSEPFLRILQLCPRLEELMLSDPSSFSLTPEVLVRLTVGDPRNVDHETLVPRLRLFGLDAVQRSFDPSIFASMLQSRWRQKSLSDPNLLGTNVLHSIIFRVPYDTSRMDLDPDRLLEGLEKEGLVILSSYVQSWLL